MVPELEPVANDFFNAEVQRDRAYRKVEGAGDQDVAVTQIAGPVDQGLGSRKDRWFERHLEEIVGQANETVAMHSTIGTERKDIEEGPRIQIEPEEKRHAHHNFRNLVDALQQRALVAGIVRMSRDEVAGQL